jgi:hypothetical protein
LKVTILTSNYSTATSTNTEYAVQINSIDRVVKQMQHSVGNDRTDLTGIAFFTAAEVPAGTYTARARWRRASGGGTPTAAATDDWLTLLVEEVGPEI